MHLNVIQIDHKCNKTGKCSPTRIYPTERRLQNKPGKHKRRGALSETISYCIYSKTRHSEQTWYVLIRKAISTAALSLFEKYIEDITWPRGDTKFLFEC